MAEASCLVDSSIWIEALSPRGPEKLQAILRTLLEANRAVITEMIRLEVLAGSRSSKEFDQFRQDFSAIRCLEATPEAWHQAEDLAFTLARQGLHVPAADLLIAAVAISHEVALWHADRDFERIKQALKTFKTLWHPQSAPVV